MRNVNVFTGADASLVLAVDDKATEEGKLADALIAEYEFSSMVGRLQNVHIQVQNELRPYHEIGKRWATELRPGNINIAGYAERAHVNGAMLRLLLGDGATTPPTGAVAQPAFNMVINLNDSSVPGAASKLVLFGVKFDGWKVTVPEDEFVMEQVTFRALRISSEEASA